MANFVTLEGRIKGDGEWINEAQSDGFSARAYIEVERVKDGEMQPTTKSIKILCHEVRVFRDGEQLRVYGIYNQQREYFVPIWSEKIDTVPSGKENRYYF